MSGTRWVFAVIFLLWAYTFASSQEGREILRLNTFISHNDRADPHKLPDGHWEKMENFDPMRRPGMLVARDGMYEPKNLSQVNLADTALRLIKAQFNEGVPGDYGYPFYVIVRDSIHITPVGTTTAVRETISDSLIFQSPYSDGLNEDAYGTPSGPTNNYGDVNNFRIGLVPGTPSVHHAWIFNDSIVSIFGSDTILITEVDSVVFEFWINSINGSPSNQIFVAAQIPDSNSQADHSNWIDGDYNAGTAGFPNQVYAADTAGMTAGEMEDVEWGADGGGAILISDGYTLLDSVFTDAFSGGDVASWRVDQALKNWAYNGDPNLGIRIQIDALPSETWQWIVQSSEFATAEERPRWKLYWTHDLLDSTFTTVAETTVALGYLVYKASGDLTEGWRYVGAYLNYPSRLNAAGDTVNGLDHNRGMSYEFRQDALRLNAANEASNDTALYNTSLWHGAVGDSFFYSGDTLRYWSTQSLWNRTFTPNTGAGWMNTGTSRNSADADSFPGRRTYRSTFIYDYFQESTFLRDSSSGRVDEQFEETSESSHPVHVTLSIRIDNSVLPTVTDTVWTLNKLNRRITSINVYRADTKFNTLPGDADFRLLEEFSLVTSDTSQFGGWGDLGGTVTTRTLRDTVTADQLSIRETYHSRIGHFSDNDWLTANITKYVQGRRFAADVFKWADDSISVEKGARIRNAVYYCALQNVTAPAQFSPDVWPADHFFIFGDRESEITALAEWRGRLLVFSRNALYMLYVNDPIENSVVEETKFIDGPLNHRSVHETPYGIVWIGNDGIYLFNGQTVDLANSILPNAPWDAGKNHFYNDGWFGIYDNVKNTYNAIFDSTIYTYYFDTGGWTRNPHSKNSANRAIKDAISPDTTFYLWSTSKGVVARKTKAVYNSRDNTTSFDKILRSGRITFGNPHEEKFIHGLNILYNIPSIVAPFTTAEIHLWAVADNDTISLTDTLKYYKILNDSTQWQNKYLPLSQSTSCYSFQFELWTRTDEIDISEIDILFSRRVSRAAAEDLP